MNDCCRPAVAHVRHSAHIVNCQKILLEQQQNKFGYIIDVPGHSGPSQIKLRLSGVLNKFHSLLRILPSKVCYRKELFYCTIPPCQVCPHEWCMIAFIFNFCLFLYCTFPLVRFAPMNNGSSGGTGVTDSLLSQVGNSSCLWYRE